MKTRSFAWTLAAAVLVLFTQCGNDTAGSDEHPAGQPIDGTSGGHEADGTYQEEYKEIDSTDYSDSI